MRERGQQRVVRWMPGSPYNCTSDSVAAEQRLAHGRRGHLWKVAGEFVCDGHLLGPSGQHLGFIDLEHERRTAFCRPAHRHEYWPNRRLQLPQLVLPVLADLPGVVV